MILVTGAAGFIGFHVAQRLLADGHDVHGLDNFNDYYDPKLKRARLKLLTQHSNFTFHEADIRDPAGMQRMFSHGPQTVLHLAAQPGVRYSMVNPRAYTDTNITGFLNVLEGCRNHDVSHLVFASSSSVYGLNSAMPYRVGDNVDHPVSLYAATKKANELMAHTYSHLFKVPATALRFFTVYGPWGRPDMATFIFTKAIIEGRPIDLFNYGRMKRDFTYIDDIVEGIVRLVPRPPSANPNWNPTTPDPASSSAPYRVYNIGNHSPVELLRFVEILESLLGRKAVRNLLPLQPGDVLESYADVQTLSRDVGFEPNTSIEEGLHRFVSWYREYHHI